VVATILVWATSSCSSIPDENVHPRYHRLLAAWATPSQAIDTNRVFTEFLDIDHMVRI